MGNQVKDLIKIWQSYANGNDEFDINPDMKIVEGIANGVLENEKNHGLKYCPCRLMTGRREEDLKLICPCNFFIQTAWREKGECWCGLFIKKNK